jgi:FixJ family two-component response regulator
VPDDRALEIPAFRHRCVTEALEVEDEAGWVRIPVIVIKGRDDVATRVRAQRAGAAAYLPKPSADDALIAAIDAALGRG